MINYLIENKNLIFISIIILCITVIYNQYNTIQDKNEEIYLLENITEEFNVSLQNIDNELNNNNNNNNNNNKSFANRVFKDCPECPECDEKQWDGPPCSDCKECPQFYNDRVIYKNLITKYKIEFPDYEMLSNEEKDILHGIFMSDTKVPEPNIEDEYFPYNILQNKIDMDNIMPSMA